MTHVRLGLHENAGQFAILVALNALVGSMVGFERSVLPLIGKVQFDLQSILVAATIWQPRGGLRAVALGQGD